MARTPTTTQTTRKPRATPNGPRTTNVLLRCVDIQTGLSVPMPSEYRLELVAISGDARKVLAAIRADRNLIEMEYVFPQSETAATPAPLLREAAE